MSPRFKISNLFRSQQAPESAVAAGADPRSQRATVIATDEEFLEATYWIVLGRQIDDEWRRIRLRHLELGQSRESVLQALFGSSEFQQRYHGYHDVTNPDAAV